MSVKHSPKASGRSTSTPSSAPSCSSSPTLSGNDGVDISPNYITTRKPTRRLGEDDVSDSRSIMSEMNKLFASFERKQDSRFESLSSTMSNVMLQNSEIQKSIDFFSTKYDALLDRLDKTERENDALKKRIFALENTVDVIERNARSAMLEIRNISNSDSENKISLTEIVKNIGNVVNQPINMEDIKDVHRLVSRNSDSSPILVEFCSSTVKESVIKSVKTFNKTNQNSKLSTAHLQLKGPRRPVFVSDSLTSRSRHLFYLARDLAKRESFEGCWTAYGKIYVKKKTGMPATRIFSEDDLHKINMSPL